ncbi:MAG: rhomboid family intramembrane serine protease [Deltaproteobacteria bacterium]|nr:rhomboid family intramembrane serine protease [Deltaproteobacteria bacterium]
MPDPQAPRAQPPGAVPWVSVVAALTMLAAFAAAAVHGVDARAPTADALIAIGGNYGPALARGQIWRLLIAPFIHLGAFHLLWNLVGLALVVPPLERALGARAALVVLVAGALGGGAADYAAAPYAVSVGASGALFAAAIALALALARPAIAMPRRVTAIRLAVFAVAAIGAALAPAAVDPWAHIGGALAGVAAAVALGARPGLARRAATSAGVVAMTAAVISLAAPPVDVRGATEATAALEQRFDQRVPDDPPVPDPQLAQWITTEMLPPLDRIRAGLGDDPRMPEALAQRTRALTRYIDARRRALAAFAAYVDSGDPSLRAAIAAADRDATAALEAR